MQTAPLRILKLAGGPRDRGRAHGEDLRGPIATLLALWGDALEQGYGVDRRRYIVHFAQTAFESTLARYAPGVLEELRGIAEGAGADYLQILAFQHVNEEFDLAPRIAGLTGVGEACSTIAAPPAEDRPALIGQNLDLAQFLDGFQILLRSRCDRSDGDILTLSVPGMISLMGMNSHGFAVCDNALTQLRTARDGVPVFALYRLLLESRNLDEALALVRSMAPAAGLNWVMGDGGGVAMVEHSAGRVVCHLPGDAPAYHTNHPLASDDWAAPSGNGRARPRPPRSSYLRLAALHQRLRPGAAITVDGLKAILASRDDADYPVSRGGGNNLEDQQIGFTLACNIFELRHGDPTWHLAAGPPHERPFHTYRFD